MAGVPTYSVITPAAALVSVADARAYGGVPAATPDAIVQGYIAAALGFLDGPDGWLNRSLGEQTIACTIASGIWSGLGPVEPVILAGGPVTGLVSVAGISGTDSFGSPAVRLAGDILRICQPCGPTWGSASADIVVTYTAGSPPGVLAQVKPTLLAMVAKMVSAAAVAGRDPTLRSESIPDTFSKSWDTSGQSGSFGAVTLAPIAHLRRWS